VIPDQDNEIRTAEDAFAAVIAEHKAAEAGNTEQQQEKPAAREFNRDDQGRFAAGEQQQEGEKEPFEGFSQLPEPAQAAYRQLMGERDTFSRERDELRRKHAEVANRVPYLQRELAKYQHAPQQKPAPTAKQAAELKKWEDLKQRFPEDAEAIDEKLNALRQEFGDVGSLAKQLAELKEWKDTLQTERENAEIYAAHDALAERVPDWKVLAGFEDADGNPIDPSEAVFHPEVAAWIDAQPGYLKKAYLEVLTQTRDTDAQAEIFERFKGDYLAALEAEEAANGQPSTQPQGNRKRQDALADVSPTGGGGNGLDRDERKPFGPSREDAFADTVSRYREQFRTGRR